MKFGHLLKTFEEDAGLPEDGFPTLNYKKLKKLIKAHTKQQKAEGAGSEGEPAAAPSAAAAAAAGSAGSSGAAAAAAEPAAAAGAAAVPAAEHAIAEEDREFISTLNEDLSRINSAFMEKEEDAVIRLRALQDRLEAAAAAAGTSGASGGSDARTSGAAGGQRDGGGAAPELEQLRNEMVDFHGELVLLLHWSLVNYAAVAKILKKHDKLTGSRLRAPVLASVLHQPFLSTESISQLVKEAERHVQELTQLCGGAGAPPAPPSSAAGAGAGGAEGAAAAGGAGEGAAAGMAGLDPELALEGSHVAIYKRTRAALHMLNDMQATATTPSTLLPPPLTAHSDADGHKKQRTSVDGGQQGEHPAAQGSNTHQQQAQQQQQAQAQQQQPSVPAVQVPT